MSFVTDFEIPKIDYVVPSTTGTNIVEYFQPPAGKIYRVKCITFRNADGADRTFKVKVHTSTKDVRIMTKTVSTGNFDPNLLSDPIVISNDCYLQIDFSEVTTVANIDVQIYYIEVPAVV